MNKLVLIYALLAFTTPALAWEGKAIELDNGTWKYQRLKIKDLDTGKTKRIKYRIHGVNRDRIKVYDYETKEIKKYKIRRRKLVECVTYLQMDAVPKGSP